MFGGSPPPRTSSWSWNNFRSRRNSESEARPLSEGRSRRNSEGQVRPSSMGSLFSGGGGGSKSNSGGSGSPGGSRSSSRPGTGSGSKRNSLSALDSSSNKSSRDGAAAAIRNEVADFMAAHLDLDLRDPSVVAADSVNPLAGAAVVSGGATRHNRRTSTVSHPPLSYFNNPKRAYNHHRAYSAAPIVQQQQQPPPLFSNNEDPTIRLPPPRPKSASFIGQTSHPVSGQAPVFPASAAMPMGSMPLAMYPPRDQEAVMRTKGVGAGIHQVPLIRPTPRLDQGPKARSVPVVSHQGPSPGLERPGLYNHPRRFSNSSTVSSASSLGSSRDSFESRLRSSSIASSQTSIESMPPLKSRFNTRSATAAAAASYAHHQKLQSNGQYYHPWHKPAPAKTYRRKAKPGELFAALPGEVLELILEELRKLHMQPGGGNSCATCWMRDCCSVALSARKFLKHARKALYQNIQLVGAESLHMKKRTKVNHGSRLILLRRTLRANTHIAGIVRSLKPPSLPLGAAVEKYNDLVASVVMACPNLERLVGYYPSYNHSFQRLFHALSTRPTLKEMNWIIEASPLQQQQRHHRSRPSGSGNTNHLWAEEELQPHQSRWFLNYHLNWQQLTTLLVHCQPGGTLASDKLVARTLRCLPRLENLHLSHLSPASFNDANLLSLPPLKKLSLSHLPGITTAGLSSLATRSTSISLTTLTLVHMNVETLPVLARIFSHLPSLDTFNLVQPHAPMMPTDELVLLFPYLASPSLRKLHWDIPYLPTRATTADTILAKSISANGFPALRILRAPNDPEGIFQSLCSPRERADLPTDRFRGGAGSTGSGARQSTLFRGLLSSQQQPSGGHGRAASDYYSRPSSSSSSPLHSNNRHAWPGGTMPTSPSSAPTSPMFPPDSLLLPRDNSNLHHARLAAQARLEAARRFPRFFVNVIDDAATDANGNGNANANANGKWNGGNSGGGVMVVERYGIGAFIGTAESKIRYVLTPDPGATDEGGGLVGVADLLRDNGEALVLPPPPPSSSETERDRDGRSSSKGRRRSSSIGRWSERKKAEAAAAADGQSNRIREGCVGRWNTLSGPVVDKKDRERWWHVERGRWRAVVLS